MSDESSIPQRTCTKCHTPFPATLEYFHKQKNGKYGLSSWCITCHRAVNNANLKERRATDPELVQRQNEYKKEYRETHREEIAAYNKEYYWSRVEQERERVRVNHVRFAVQRREYRLKYDKKPEVVSRRNRWAKGYYANRIKNDPEFKLRTQTGKRNYKLRKRNATGSHTASDIAALYAEQEGRCAYCGVTVFWDIVGDIHVDHIIPLARGGANDLSNLAIACADCNLSKSKKAPDEWQSIRQW